MATRDELIGALRQADAAGDTQAAQRFAEMIKAAPVGPVQQAPTPEDQTNPSAGGSVLNIAGFDTGIKTPQFLDRFLAGAGKSLADTGAGLKQLYSAAADKVAPVASGPSRSAQTQQAVDLTAQRDAPLMHTAAGVTGNIAGQLAQFGPAGGALTGRAISLIPRIARGAAIGAAIANTQPVTSDQSRLTNTGLGAAGGAAGEALAAGFGKLAAGAVDTVSPEVKALAQRARELGIPLRAEQVTQSRPLAGVSAALDTLPFSGRDASRAVQRSAFNRAVAGTFGQDTDNVATAVKQATRELGSKYDAVLTRYPITADSTLVNDLDTALQGARAELNDSQFGVIQRQVDNLLGKVGPNDQIDAQAAYNAKKVLDRIGRSQDSSLAYHANELRDSLLSALDRTLPEDVGKSFAKTREQYANLIAVRKLVKAGAEGNVTPASLANAKTRGSLKEVADIGAQFLKEPFGNSGTANRQIGAHILGALGGAAYFNPQAALTAGAAGATIGRGTNMALQSPVVTNYLMNGSRSLEPLIPYANHLLPTAGAIATQ